MESMAGRVKAVSLVSPAVKGSPDPMACRADSVLKETPAPTDRRALREILERMASPEELEAMGPWDPRATEGPAEPMGTRESAAMMAHPEQMDPAETGATAGRRASRVPVETEEREEGWGSQDLAENRGGRGHLGPTETQACLEEPGLLDTEEMKDHLDRRGPKDHEGSKELQETEARWERGERTVSKETEQRVAMVSRDTLVHVETRATRVAREHRDPKEMTESPGSQAQITTCRGIQDPRALKVTEDLREDRDHWDLLDTQELMNVKFWTSS